MKTICVFMCLTSFAKWNVNVVMVIVETDHFFTCFLMFLFLYCHTNTLAIDSAAQLLSNHYLQLFPHFFLQVCVFMYSYSETAEAENTTSVMCLWVLYM